MKYYRLWYKKEDLYISPVVYFAEADGNPFVIHKDDWIVQEASYTPNGDILQGICGVVDWELFIAWLTQFDIDRLQKDFVITLCESLEEDHPEWADANESLFSQCHIIEEVDWKYVNWLKAKEIAEALGY